MKDLDTTGKAALDELTYRLATPDSPRRCQPAIGFVVQSTLILKGPEHTLPAALAKVVARTDTRFAPPIIPVSLILGIWAIRSILTLIAPPPGAFLLHSFRQGPVP